MTTDDSGTSRMLPTVTEGSNEDEFRAMIDAGADFNKTNNNGATALFDAVRQTNNESVVRALIDAGADVNITNNNGATALFDAVQQSNNESVVHALIDAGADVNITNNNGATALFDAVQQSNNESVVRALIDAGADVNVTRSDGKTALIYAVQQSNNESVVHALIDAGADVNKTYYRGATALFDAVQQRNNESVVRALIDAGADVNKTGSLGETALFYAVQQSNNASMVRALIDAGADVNITKTNGATALIHAVYESNNESVVQALIDAGADVNKTTFLCETALFFAVQPSNNESVVHALLDANADLNVTRIDGKTALFDAVQQSNNESVVRALINAGADVNITCIDDGATALFDAVQQSNNESVVRAMIDAGAFVNARNIYGRTPLFYALHDPETTCTLLDKGGKQHLFLKDNCNCSILAYFVETNVLRLSEKIFHATVSLSGSLDLLCEQGFNKASIVQTIINIAMSKFPLTIPAPGRYDWRHDNIPSMSHSLTTEKFLNALKVASSYVDESYSHQKINLVELFENKIGNPEKISEALRLLIELSADPNSVDAHGNTALHYTTGLAWMGVPQETVMEICHQLEKLGVQLNLRNHENETPLLFCLSGDLSKLKDDQLLAVQTLVKISGFLLKHGSSIEGTSRNQDTVFHLILNLFQQGLELEDKKTRQNVLQEMLGLLQLFPPWQVTKAGIINIPDADLNTPLHLWASLRLPSCQDYATSITNDQTFEEFLQIIFKYLLECEAQLGPRNRINKTPLHLCKTWNATKLLLDAEAIPTDVDLFGCSSLLIAAMRIWTIKNPVAFYPDISESEDHKKFWETAIEKGLDPWAADKGGRTVLGILVKCESFVLAKALVDVACERNYTQSESFTICLLNAICKDKSTQTKWKSNLVQDILKSRKVPTNLSEALRLCCENIVKTGVFDEVLEYEGVVIFAPPDSEDKSLHGEISLPIEKGNINQSPKETGIQNRSVHIEIMNVLRSHGAGGESCLDLKERCPQLQDLLMKPLDNDTIPVLIPWTSVSKRYAKNLAKVARRQECEVVQDRFWHHSDHIGSGSYGDVFVGINEKDGREVAIKCIVKSRMQRQEDKREITNLTALADCEQVVRYLHFFEDEKFAYIVLELMEGNLDEYLTDGFTFDAGKSTHIGEDVVKGLKYLHEQDIIHRDLKPGNILYKIHPKLCLKIADFGLSRRIDSTASTVYGTNAGTRCWIAPEVLMGTHDHSKSSDMFSCGLLLHYILSPQKHPFSSPVDSASKGEYQIVHETEANIMHDKMEGWDKCVSAEATHLIKKMLESSKINRPTAQQALDHLLFWSNTKKMDLLIAVGNQPVFEYPRTGKTTCSTVVKADLEKKFSTIVVHGMWNDPRYKNMPAIYTEMTSSKRKSYNTYSVVELVRFIRNAYAHVSEDKRPTRIKEMLLEDFVFLEYFPNLVMEVYKVVITHGWDQTRNEIKYAMNK